MNKCRECKEEIKPTGQRGRPALTCPKCKQGKTKQAKSKK